MLISQRGRLLIRRSSPFIRPRARAVLAAADPAGQISIDLVEAVTWKGRAARPGLFASVVHQLEAAGLIDGPAHRLTAFGEVVRRSFARAAWPK